MALNIKNEAVESLVDELARTTSESKVETVRRALQERRERLASQAMRGDQMQALLRYLEHDVWPLIPPAELGHRLSREEEEAILGYGEAGA